MLTNKNSKFFFYNFNRLGEPIEKVRHTIISEEKRGLLVLQIKDWSYFIGNCLKFQNKSGT